MKFNEGAGLDTSQVQDRRGSGGGSGGGLGGLGGVAAGGGGLGLVAVVIFVLIQMFSGGGSSSGSSGSSGSGVLDQMSGQGGTADNSQLSESCRTGADANTKDDCAAVAIINSVQAYWTDAMSKSGTTYNPAETVFYSGSTPTGCGTGTSGMGPFYCPTDKTVYVDLSFWNDLKTQFGADSGTFTQAYVLAHEYGHHVQDVLGTSDRVGTANGSDLRLGPVGVAGRLLCRSLGQARHHRPRLRREGAGHGHHPERRERGDRHRRQDR